MVGLGTGLSNKVIAFLERCMLCDQLYNNFDIDHDLPYRARLMALRTALLKEAKVGLPRGGRPRKSTPDAVTLSLWIDEEKRLWPHRSVKELIAMLKEGLRTNPKLKNHPQRKMLEQLLRANVDSLITKVSYGRGLRKR